MQTAPVIAVIDANQVNLEAKYNTQKKIQVVEALITALEANELINIVVVSTDNAVINQLAFNAGVVNRHEEIEQSPQALLASVTDSSEGFVDEDSWVLYVNAQLGDHDFEEVISRAFTARSVNPNATGLRAVGLGDRDLLHLFRAGSFNQYGDMPVDGSIDYLAN